MMNAKKNAPSISYNVETIRDDFPILQNKMNGTRLSFLDTAASAQKPASVIAAEQHAYEREYANIHRGVYALSQNITTKYEEARQKIATFINAKSDNEIIFTRGTTESINLVAQTWARANLSKGDAVLITEQEHHANIVPWQMLRDQIGIELQVVPMQMNGDITLEDFTNTLTSHTKLCAFPHVSNSLGTILPIKEMIQIAQNHGARTLIDGAQGIVHGLVDVQDLNADFYTFSGHKLYGPNGIGILYGKADLLAEMPPYQGGGDMIKEVSFEKTTYAEAPAKFEAGTPNIVGAIGLGAAVDYVTELGQENIKNYEHDLLIYAEDALQTIEGVQLFSKATHRTGVISFNVDGLHPHDVGAILDQCGVAVRVGHHCAQPVLKKLGVSATIRASLGCYTNKEDIDQLVDGIKTAKRLLG